MCLLTSEISVQNLCNMQVKIFCGITVCSSTSFVYKSLNYQYNIYVTYRLKNILMCVIHHVIFKITFYKSLNYQYNIYVTYRLKIILMRVIHHVIFKITLMCFEFSIVHPKL